MARSRTTESMPEIIDFRAPPPSPIASGRRSSVTNDQVLTEFLESSLRVPDLILPDKLFPKHKNLETPPLVDYESLSLHEDGALCDVVLDSIARMGCFQLLNHGIPPELMRSAAEAAKGVFLVPPEKRGAVMRSLEKPYGFEEYHAHAEEEEEVNELNQEFVWCRDEHLSFKMEGIWPIGYSNFSKKMETLCSSIDKVAHKILLVISKHFARNSPSVNDMSQGHEMGTVCCVYKQSLENVAERWANSLRYDVIRMLIRGTDYSHALCLHVCDGSSEFHVYSKKGWLSFYPEKGALIVTVGDQIQTLSDGQYKHVIGRPIFKSEKEDCISMAFLCSPPSTNEDFRKGTNRESTISLRQQAILAIILTLVYHVFVYADGDKIWAEILRVLINTIPKCAHNTPLVRLLLYNTFETEFHASFHSLDFDFFELQNWLEISQPKMSSSPDELKIFVDLSDAPFSGDAHKSSPESKDKSVADISDVQFEARSMKDGAWYDVASFLTYRIVSSGELEARVRFAGFGKEQDEWINVKEAVRERSIPLEPSDCHKVKVGDLVLCFQEREEYAVYCDARVIEIQTRVHDQIDCCCIFVVRYAHDNSKEGVLWDRLCCRPTQEEPTQEESVMFVNPIETLWG
ncbi:hypothetical protein L6164_021497 [Bauhinia variegata]|uniref:Uncharacterized protein n=1 Tax=Bauhinia variegata TaxID=167791 RepID=A0ACB9N035_BAUVA|nr:hypothetical protein L6164_021497 [Bauhinia variegata]